MNQMLRDANDRLRRASIALKHANDALREAEAEHGRAVDNLEFIERNLSSPDMPTPHRASQD